MSEHEFLSYCDRIDALECQWAEDDDDGLIGPADDTDLYWLAEPFAA